MENCEDKHFPPQKLWSRKKTTIKTTVYCALVLYQTHMLTDLYTLSSLIN